MRALTALTLTAPAAFEPALTALYHAYWVDRRPTHKPEVLRAVLAETLGSEVSAEKVLEKAQEQKTKDALIRTTEKAVEDGAFGLPWFVATNGKGETEHFWGFDHLGQICAFLELERPNDGGWRALL